MISLEFDYNSSKSLYVQLYEYLKSEITEGRIETGERLPSLRNLADTLGVSVTTVKTAYEQLIVEGYMISRPQSGFYAAQGAVTGEEPESENNRRPVPASTEKRGPADVSASAGKATRYTGR